MNGIEKFSKKIEKTGHRLMQPKETLLDGIIQQFMTQIGSAIKTAADCWKTNRKRALVEMADNGWYPNWFTFFYAPRKAPCSINELMESHLEENWKDITAKILELCPNREHILKIAFQLHTDGNYIAAIPLFFKQIDGICCETFKYFLFTKNDLENKIKNLIDKKDMFSKFLLEPLLEPLTVKNHYDAGIREASQIKKDKASNRNGIIHGHHKYLDYGTKRNSLKTFSLLSFIAYLTYEIKKNNKLITERQA